MKKILTLLPESTIGKSIIEGLSKGFEQNKCRISKKDFKKLTTKDIEDFHPDAILGFGASFLTDKNFLNIIKYCAPKILMCFLINETKETVPAKIHKTKIKVYSCNKKVLKTHKDAIYLPLGINAKDHLTEFSGYKHTISFIGNPSSKKVQNILCELVKEFKNKINVYSDKKAFSKSLEAITKAELLEENEINTYSKSWRGEVNEKKDLAEIYNASKINICLNEDKLVGQNIFETLAAGGFLITNGSEELKILFDISKDLETFENINDLIDKINFYLKNLNIAQKIAQLGKFEVIKNHTFSARARKILETAFA